MPLTYPYTTFRVLGCPQGEPSLESVLGFFKTYSQGESIYEANLENVCAGRIWSGLD
jgi:hypothetical protein